MTKKNLEIDANLQLEQECEAYGFHIQSVKPDIMKKRNLHLKQGLVLSVNKEQVQLQNLIERNSFDQELWEVWNITTQSTSYEWI